MKQMARGALALVALIGLSACVDDPQERINNDDFHTLQAYPEVAWIRSNQDSVAFYFRLLNDFGYGTPTHLELSEVTGPIKVNRDTLFRRYYEGGNSAADTSLVAYIDGHLQRFYVIPQAPGEASFKMTASNGAKTTVRIRIEAGDLGALPTRTAVVGQSITLQAPTFQIFSQDAQVAYMRGARPTDFPTKGEASRAGTQVSAGAVTNIAADGSSLTFRATADLYGKVIVTRTLPTHAGVIPDFTPAPLSSTDSLTTPGIGSPREIDYTHGLATDTLVPAGASVTAGGVPATSPNPDQEVVVNLGGIMGSTGSAPGIVTLAMLRNSRVYFGSVEAGIVHRGDQPESAAISDDSSTVTVIAPAHLTPTGPATSIPVMVSNVGLSIDPGFLLGGSAAAVTAVQIGAPVKVQIGSVSSTGNPANTADAVVGNYHGGSSRTTAAVLPLVGVTPVSTADVRALMVTDNGPFPTGGECGTIVAGAKGCKIYQVNFNGGNRRFSAEVRWNFGTTSTVGVYLLRADAPPPAALALNPYAMVAAASGNGGRPAFAGTNFGVRAYAYIAVVWTGGTEPLWTQLRITSGE